MEPTRRALAVGGLAVLLAASAALLARPVLLAGAATVGGWLLARQYRFLRLVSRLDRDLAVGQSPVRSTVRPGEETTVRLTASLPAPTPATVTVAAAPPVAATAPGDRRVTLRPGQVTAERELPVTWPVAGQFSFDPPAVTATDRAGLFRAAFRRGPAPVVTVEPVAGRAGTGGDGDHAVAFGDRTTGRTGRGIEAASVREYAPGEPATRIDWAASARLDRPHVREFEVTSASTTWLVVDARPSAATGRPPHTVAASLRGVALAEVTAAESANDPLGVTIVGSDGAVVERPPSSGADHYRSLRTHLHDVAAPGEPARADGRVVADRTGVALPPGSPMADALAPFRGGRPASRGGDGLAAAAAATGGVHRTVLVAGDGDRASVAAAVRRARATGSRVDVYLAPAVLYEPEDLADVERAAERYRSFEAFRRRLDGLDGVTAREVPPGDRLPTAGGDGPRGRL